MKGDTVYKVNSFQFVVDGNIPDEINAELEKRGLDATDVISVVHHYMGVLVYYREKNTDD